MKNLKKIKLGLPRRATFSPQRSQGLNFSVFSVTSVAVLKVSSKIEIPVHQVREQETPQKNKE